MTWPASDEGPARPWPAGADPRFADTPTDPDDVPPAYPVTSAPAYGWAPTGYALADQTLQTPPAWSGGAFPAGPMLPAGSGGAHAPDWARSTPGERPWATAAHWLPLVSHWIGPLVVLLTVGRRSDLVREEATASLNWEITVALLLALAALVSGLGVIGPALALAIVVLSVALHAIGAVTVARGGTFVYPLAIPFIR